MTRLVKQTLGVVLMVVTGVLTVMPKMAFASGDNVLVSVSTDKEVYSAGSLGTTPILVSIDIENQTSDTILLIAGQALYTDSTASYGLMVITNVDLPAPERPTKPIFSPGLIFISVHFPAATRVSVPL